MPALKALDGRTTGLEAASVRHEFAAWSHAQLANPDNKEALKRSQDFRRNKGVELTELENIIKSTKNDREKRHARADHARALKWLQLDEAEYKSLLQTQQTLVNSCLENYLAALHASERHKTDVLKFIAVWFEHAEEGEVNQLVRAAITKVPSRKFAPLVTQLASKLQDTDDRFQKQDPGGSDRKAQSRNSAAIKIAKRLAASTCGRLWLSLVKANNLYIQFANLKDKDVLKAGAKVPLKTFVHSKELLRVVPELGVPPLTMTISLRHCDYKDVPKITEFGRDMIIASGLSAPKIVSVRASSGQTLRQLVFYQVSNLLSTETDTKLRNLSIRTYNVVPLDASSGVIEFVQPTTPLNDFLQIAHPKYCPNDLKWAACRKKVADAQESRRELRLKTYQSITKSFNPVLRHFFLESLKIRTNGEVVHIDLGVAFEAGRILNVPEVVPFRLTRDIVDGFGIMKTEGVQTLLRIHAGGAAQEQGCNYDAAQRTAL
ncbi:hypothetical protein MRB53_042142 [Persea americana]|nr:hypothetical protein MRB53_042142 [Persea americana]